ARQIDNNTLRPTKLTSVLCIHVDDRLAPLPQSTVFFFYTAPTPTEIYTLSLHDALPICTLSASASSQSYRAKVNSDRSPSANIRSEEHTSELQSPYDLVCRLLLEKKKDGGPRRRRSGSLRGPQTASVTHPATFRILARRP